MSEDDPEIQHSEVEKTSIAERLSNTSQNISAALTIIATLVTIGVPIASGVIPTGLIGDYVLMILLIVAIIWFRSYHKVTVKNLRSNTSDLRAKVSNLEDEIEEANRYSHLIDQKNTSPVLVNRKEIMVEICEGGPDEITFTFVISAPEGNKINKYTALIGTDIEDAKWEDLDFNIEGGSVSTYRRRDFNEFRRFVVEIELFENVSFDETYELSFSVNDDVLTPEDDEVIHLVREPTDQTATKVVFPEGWEPKRRVAEGRGDLEVNDLPRPTKTLKDGYWQLNWEYNSCEIRQSYVVDYTAEKTN